MESIHVLHVDDDQEFADVAASFLERQNDTLTVETASTAEAGLDRLAESPEIQCIVSDYQMPGRNGLDLLEAAREGHPDLPFILFTAEGSEEIASEAISAGVTDYLEKTTDTEQFELLANRIENAASQYEAERRADEQARINTIINDIHGVLMRASSREEIDRAVCTILSDADPYVFAWIGERESDTDQIRPRASAGFEDGYLDDVTITADDSPTGRGLVGTAIRTQEPQASQNVQDDPALEPWHDAARARGYRAIAAIPLVYDGGCHGVLIVYSDRRNAFDDAERSLLQKLGDDIAHALHAVSVRNRLERYEQMVNTASDMVYILDTDGCFRFVNDAAVSLTGYSRDELVEEHVSVIMNEEAIERGRDLIQGLLRGPSPEEPSDAFDWTLHTADGETVPCESHITLLYDDGDWNGTVGVVRDITDRKHRERRIESLHEATRELMTADSRREAARHTAEAAKETLGFAISAVRLVSDDGAHLDPVALTQATRTVLGERPRYPVDDSPPGRAYTQGEVIVHDDVRELDDGYDRKDGRAMMYLPIGEYGTLSIGDTEVGAFDESDVSLASTLVANAEAVLDRLERERELARQNERLKEFANIVSHDLRNPLNVAQGNLGLVRENGDEAYFEKIDHAHGRMEMIIEDLLTLARQGQTVDEPEPVRLDRIAEAAWEIVETNDATVSIEADCVIHADRSRLQQLFENLFRNAIEHGGRDVTVRVGTFGDASGFYVEDDGPGIADADREDVFDSGYSTDEEGTGLGLAIVEEIAGAHGWETDVTGGRDGGARFDITGVEQA